MYNVFNVSLLALSDSACMGASSSYFWFCINVLRVNRVQLQFGDVALLSFTEKELNWKVLKE